VFVKDKLSFDRSETVKINESVRLYFTEKVKAGQAKLSIKFTGTLNENLSGFYKTKCTFRDGTCGFAAVTQFEVLNIHFVY
jgi:hypothetical protein